MKFIDEYRDMQTVSALLQQIKKISKKDITIMEVCGGHTMAIHKFGIPGLLPKNINLISGPGCPVCVTSRIFIDKAIALSKQEDVIITTYGDLIRVPGSTSSLEKERSKGRNIQIVYSTLDALKIARNNRDKKIVFLGIGFETTTPSSAAAIKIASEEKLNNFFVLSSHKLMPPAMGALIDEGVKINGYMAPGHVSTITGSGIYTGIPEKYNVGCVVSGFEPADVLQTIYMLVKQHEENQYKVEIQYTRAVNPEGNIKAQQLINEIFEPCDDWWRGLGMLPNSGLKIKEELKTFDAEYSFRIIPEPTKEDKGCICGEILKGLKKPVDCALFGKSCTPADPVGACMVSNEGACNAFYSYDNI